MRDDYRLTLLITMLNTVRGSLRALDMTISVLLDFLEQPAEEAPASTPDPVPVPESDECAHPPSSRVSAPSMGHPNRYYCRLCTETVG
jgi:hypothetical protein